jgi:hypothetical protein
MTDDLTEARLRDYEEPRSEEERAAWRIESDDQASWALRKLRAYSTEVDRLATLAARERARIRDWQDDRTRSLLGHISFFEQKLIDYRMRLERDNPKLAQTYHVPGGAITRRRSSLRIEVKDRDAFVGWAEENDPGVVKMSPLVQPLKDRKDRYHLDEETGVVVDLFTGQKVPGVEVLRDPDQYGTKLETEVEP